MTNEPLIKLEPGGRAPILSYNVPEPTSYNGRNYIDLALDQSWFKQRASAADTSTDVPTIVKTAEPRPAELLPGSVDGGEGGALSNGLRYNLVVPSSVLRLGEASAATEAATSERLSPELASLDAEKINAVLQSGRTLEFYRSLYGTLTYRVMAPVATDGTSTLPTEPELPTYISLTITSPKQGDTVAGPSTGVTLNIAGTAKLFLEDGFSPVDKVEVQIGTASFQEAELGLPDDWTAWTFSGTVTTPGTIKITARATYGSITKTKSVSVTVSFTATEPGDAVAPTVNITSPVDGAIVVGSSGGISVDVAGTASDVGSGVKLVEITVDNDATKYVPATPKAEGDWSSWTGSALITTLGAHTIVARCTDHAGNVATSTIALTVAAQPPAVPKVTRLLLVESYRLSSYLGNYGAGRVIKTFTLLPGERTKISVRTYTRRETEAKSASSILDSFTEESSQDFQNSTTAEQSYKENYDESFKYRVGAEAHASWGWGSAAVSGEVSGGTNAAREEFAKNVTNATQKHAARASAKRDVQVNTSYEVKEQTGEETSIEREIENINVSRTLNFVFRQMNQEFITLLHLVDVRVGFFQVIEGQEVPVYREATLPQLNSFLAEVIVPEQQAYVRDAILHQLGNIFDYRDEHHSFYEEKEYTDRNGAPVRNSKHLRVKKDYTSTYQDPVTGTEILVPGIILAATKNVLRTEGIIVEALLGQGDALDAYSHGLQDEAVKAKQLDNAITEQQVAKSALEQKVIQDKDAAAAKLFGQVYPCCPEPALTLNVAKPEEDGGEPKKS